MTNQLSEARKDYFDKLDKGSKCPCCDRWGKRYKRQLNSTIGHALMAMFAIHLRTDQEWIHVEQIRDLMLQTGCRATHPTGEIGKAAYHELVEQKPNLDTKKRTSGLWKLTDEGKTFVEGRSTIPRFFFLYNDELHGERFDTSEFVGINDVLGQRFNYEELLTSSYDELKSTRWKKKFEGGGAA